jgi:hypothetical protein
LEIFCRTGVQDIPGKLRELFYVTHDATIYYSEANY